MNRRPKTPASTGTRLIWCVLVLTLWFAVGVRSVASTQPEPASEADRAAMHDMLALREIIFAVHQHTQERKELPPDLAATLGAVQARTGTSMEDAIASHFTSALDEAPKRIPEDPAAWLNQDSSFKYVARAGVNPESLTDWGELAIAHLRLEEGHVFNSPDLGRVEVFSVAFLDGHVEMLPRDEAEFIINESRQVFEAVATGGELPEKRQIAADLTEVMIAIHAYAEANRGQLPPDLGAALPFVRAESPRLSTPRARARVFLTPRKAAKTFIPDEPTPQWINRNTSYVYLTGDDLRLGHIEDPQRTVLVHGRDGEEFEARKNRQMTTLVPLGFAIARAESEPTEYAAWLIDQSRQVIEFARSGAPLPEFQHVMRDMRLLHRALTEYALANDDNFPPDLGALYDYVDDPERILTDAQRAATFLSPGAEKKLTIPDSPTPEWVLQHTNYMYHGDTSINMSRARRVSTPYAVIHAPQDEPIEVRTADSAVNFMPAVFPVGPRVTISEMAEETIADAKRAMEQARDR